MDRVSPQAQPIDCARTDLCGLPERLSRVFQRREIRIERVERGDVIGLQGRKSEGEKQRCEQINPTENLHFISLGSRFAK